MSPPLLRALGLSVVDEDTFDVDVADLLPDDDPSQSKPLPDVGWVERDAALLAEEAALHEHRQHFLALLGMLLALGLLLAGGLSMLIRRNASSQGDRSALALACQGLAAEARRARVRRLEPNPEPMHAGSDEGADHMEATGEE